MKTTKKKKQSTQDQPRVLAIAPMSVGFGYAVFDHPQHLMDWGVSVVRVSKVSRALLRFEALIEMHQPTMVVIGLPDSHMKNVSIANKLTTAFARRVAGTLACKRFKRKDVQTFFTTFDALTKEEIADTLIEWLPILRDYRPEKRSVGDAQDMRIRIFDAVAVTLTFYAQHEEEQNKLA